MARDKSFSNLLKAYRDENGISQETLAHRLNVSRNYVSQIERGIAVNLSFALAKRILNLWTRHGQIEITLPRKVLVDAGIAAEIVWLNSQGIETITSYVGPPPTALIAASSIAAAREIGYEPEYLESIDSFEIVLKSEVSKNLNG